MKHNAEKNYYGKKRKREAFCYRYEGLLICVGAFRYIYDIGKKRLENLMAHLNKNGLVTREHGNLGKKSHNALRFNEVKNCIAFISRHAEIYGIPHLAPLHGRHDLPPVYLPACQDFKAVHALYIAACQESGICALGMSSFRSVWRQCLDHINFINFMTS